MGAHSQVWVASGPKGEVALKVARVPAARAALKREAEVLSEARHPNLALLLDADPEGDWLALRRVPGETFDQWAKERAVRPVIEVALQLADALEHLHERSILHGDIKPTNVIVDIHDNPHLIDLGIASRPGDVVDGFRGTLGYAAPELLSGKPPAPATDLYGLGALLYTCLTGRTPFVAPDPAALAYLPLVSLPPPAAAFRPEIPGPLDQLLLALLARDPNRRPATLDRVRQVLERSASAEPRAPFLGMHEARETLRRAVVGAADGEARVVVVYGAPGSGRRTLISEAVEYANREGLPYFKGQDADGALSTLQGSDRAAVMVMRAASRGAKPLAQRAIEDQLPCLLLLHADRPIPKLVNAGAIQITPAPLSKQEAVQLTESMGGDRERAEDWWRQSMGLPIAVLGRIEAWRRENGRTETTTPRLPTESKRIYEALRGRPRMQQHLVELAQELKMSEHALLDHCEVLFAQGLVEPQEEGLVLAVVRASSLR
ncbi:MAG: serine/threonine protein kinase [Myxococcales bacterium]|nr:serine/threonine protein kinase [Myxococcales bacterium]